MGFSLLAAGAPCDNGGRYASSSNEHTPTGCVSLETGKFLYDYGVTTIFVGVYLVALMFWMFATYKETGRPLEYKLPKKFRKVFVAGLLLGLTIYFALAKLAHYGSYPLLTQVTVAGALTYLVAVETTKYYAKAQRRKQSRK